MGNRSKSTEIELKLLLPDQKASPAVLEYMRQRGYKVEEIDSVRNTDTYLDTFDWTLMKNKLALRYRLTNGKALYTLKSVGGIEDGVAKRAETEILVDQPLADPATIPIKGLRNLVKDLIYPRKLMEHIQIRTDRRLHQIISPEGAKIELAFDSSGFSLCGFHRPHRAQRLLEMEAELLKGPAKSLPVLGTILKDRFGYAPSTVSKLETAMERLKVVIPSKKTPEALRVRLDNRLDLAVRKILALQLHWFSEQIPGVLRDIDTEFVHQGRVATRRMRSALRLFHEALPKITAAYLEDELRWLGGMFGVVRDLDVFLLNLSRFREEIKPFPKKQKNVFDDWIEKHRRKPLKALCESLQSARFEQFERRIRRFLEQPLPARPRASFARKTVREAAPQIIQDKLESVFKQGRAVMENPKLKEFHRLRIQMKRLRYACEFMASAYDGGLDPFIARTVEIQDCLGELQDTVFTRKFVRYLHDDWKGKLVDPDILFTLGQVHQLQTQIARNRQNAFSAIWERFSSNETRAVLNEIFTPLSGKP
jgi:CHAD domain-containing protein